VSGRRPKATYDRRWRQMMLWESQRLRRAVWRTAYPAMYTAAIFAAHPATATPQTSSVAGMQDVNPIALGGNYGGPSTIALLGLGSLAVGFLSNRRRRGQEMTRTQKAIALLMLAFVGWGLVHLGMVAGTAGELFIPR